MKYLLLSLIIAPFFASAEVIKFESKPTSIVIDTTTLDSCSLTTIENYTRLSIHQYAAPSDERSLITQHFETGSGCFEGYNPERITVTAQRIDLKAGKVDAKPKWVLAAQGSLGSIEDDMYKVESLGCCASVSTQKYFSLITGKLITSSTSDLMRIVNDKTRERLYIGVEANTASLPEKNGGNIATIIAGDKNGKIEKLQINSKTLVDNEWDVNEVKFVYQKDQPRYSSSETEFISDGKSTTQSIEMSIELTCRCEHDPIKISLIMLNTGIDLTLSSWNFTDKVSLKRL